eukprot:6595320-Pyramimonas_sp.AAC.1
MTFEDYPVPSDKRGRPGNARLKPSDGRPFRPSNESFSPEQTSENKRCTSPEQGRAERLKRTPCVDG